jgi:hypothetical protein
MYDVTKAIEDSFNNEAELIAWKKLAWTNSEKWLNIKFTMGLKTGKTATGAGYAILLTDDQRHYDDLSEKFKGATGEWTRDRAVLDGFYKGNSPVKSEDIVNDALKDITTDQTTAEAEEQLKKELGF